MHLKEKILPSITSKMSISRLAIFVFWENKIKLLGVSKIFIGIEEIQTEAVIIIYFRTVN